ncbi:hypothetical protein HBI40_011280 [Parastagonospora nodorum]|nr:hypothetical protein HBI41_004500 [Parastagonospora nodorum]KAH6307032.1 hypothetical protein HBI40_011280 [Parastagonospora nodorum]
MSLSKLSAEFDAHVCRCFVGDTSALSAFSKSSRYYRSVAEPYLYRDITLFKKDEHQIWRLFFTLLSCQPLTQHILRIAVAPSPDVEQIQEQDHNNKSDLWTCMSLINEVLTAVVTATLGNLTCLENRLQ